MRLEFMKLPRRPAEWDFLISWYRTKNLFHESAWLDYVEAAYPGTTTEYFAIIRGATVAGYFCPLRSRKLLQRVWGSPRGGTAFFGPLIEGCEQSEMIAALVRLCREEQIAELELCAEWLDERVMHAFDFQSRGGSAQVRPLSGDPAKVWENLDGFCRNRIRKAMKCGLRAELTSDFSIVSHFYSSFSRVLSRKGVPIPYGPALPALLFQHLTPADRLFSIWVKSGDKVIATGFYPHDESIMYNWDSAYDDQHLHQCPNELLHWTAIQMAIERGIRSFYIGGEPKPSRFSRKFGGQLTDYRIYRKVFSPVLEAVRNVYHLFDRKAAGRERPETELTIPPALARAKPDPGQ